MDNIITILNASGIILEIAGFVVLLFAIKPMPRGKGGFTSDYDYLPNVMSMASLKNNRIGIGLVIVGLLCQLTATLIP